MTTNIVTFLMEFRIISINQLIQKTMTNLTAIADLRNVKLFYCYVITVANYSLIKPTRGNRGGLDNKRVLFYVNLIKNGKFDFDLSLIQVDPDGNIVEGHHRFQALMLCEKDIVIRIVPQKNLGQICNFNSGMNPKWKPEEAFNSADTAGAKVLPILKDLKADVCTKHKISENKLSACEIYGILVKDTKHFSSGKNSPTIDMWLNNSLFLSAKKKDFKKDLYNYGKMKYELKNMRDAYKIAKAVMDLHFDTTIDFDLSTFCNILSYDGFVLDKYNTNTIRAKAISMYTKYNKTKNAA